MYVESTIHMVVGDEQSEKTEEVIRLRKELDLPNCNDIRHARTRNKNWNVSNRKK